MKKITKRYLITLAVALSIAALIFLYESRYLDIHTQEVLRMFSDSFFISGILFICGGLLCFVANSGGFDAFAFLGRKIRKKRGKEVKSDESYYEYVEKQKAKDKIHISNIFIIGGSFIILGAVFAILF